MKQLSKVQSAVFAAGAALMVIGAALAVVAVAAAPYIFSFGALAYVAIQLLQRYEGSNITVRRLRRLLIVSDVLLLATAMLLLAQQGNPLRLEWADYLRYVRGNWVVVLLIAAVLQLYAVSRIGTELEKENNKG